MTCKSFDPESVAGMTVREIVDKWAETLPENIFLIDPDANITLTYKDLQKSCQGVAGFLSTLGAKPGDAIAYAMANGANAACVILGSMYGGYISTAVNLVAGKTTIAHVFGHSEAVVVVVDSDSDALISDVLRECGFSTKKAMATPEWFISQIGEIHESSCEQDALLMYTSGTTGSPKGVVHSHSSLIAGGANAAFAHQLEKTDRALCVLPLFHINGLCVTLLGVLVSGGSLVIPNRFSITSFWQLIRDYQCSWFSVVPTQISYLLNQAQSSEHELSGLENLRFGRSASAPLSPEVQQAFETRFQVPIIETMGLTETAAQILSNPMEGPHKIGSPGIAFGNEVMIGFDDQTECPNGIEGEVLVRGPNVMRGYRNNIDATRVALSEEGWLRTGDLGKMDEDGYVFITGRLKELIIKGGENIAPREVDEALYCHADVIEAAAFARNSEQYGQCVEAGVMVREGSSVTMEELIQLCHEKIGAFKSPDFVHFLPELPKGPSGKIQRMKLAKMTQNNQDTVESCSG